MSCYFPHEIQYLGNLEGLCVLSGLYLKPSFGCFGANGWDNLIIPERCGKKQPDVHHIYICII